MEGYVMYLKSVYIILISNSNFPAITWNDFTTFVNSCKLIDENLTLSTVDRLFIATKSSGGTRELEDFPERDLARFEFYEIIVRMAAAKYKDPGKCETYNQAVKMLVEDNLMVYYNTSKWNEWREKYLWTLEVNDVLHANLDALKKIFKSFHTSKRNYMILFDALGLSVRNNNILPADKEAIYCFGMSKSTIPNEISKRINYNSLNLPEFLEFISRTAEIYFKFKKVDLKEEKKEDEKIGDEDDVDSDISESQVKQLQRSETRNSESINMLSTGVHNINVGLDTKLEILLDRLLPIYSLKRKEVKIEIEFDSDSD